MEIPPGITFLCQRLPHILIPPFLTFIVIGFSFTSFFRYELPTFIKIVFSILSLPTIIIMKGVHANYLERKNATAVGAVLPPRVKDKWPGGLSTFAAFIRNFKTGYPGDMFLNWCEQYGNTFSLEILFEHRYFTTEPEYIKAILATQFDDFEKGPSAWQQFHSLLGTGVFNSDGERWKFHRTMTRPFFSKDRISHFDVFDRNADDAISQAKARLEEGYPIDFQDMVSRFTLDSACEFLFGTNVRSLSAGLPYPPSSAASSPGQPNHPANLFSEAFAQSQISTALRSRRSTNWPLFEMFSDSVKSHRAVVDSFINPILEEAVAKKHASGGKTTPFYNDREVTEAETLLDHLVNHTEDKTILRDETLNIMLAGRDTTASTLTFAIYMLSEHPAVLRRLREEILQIVGGSARPSFEDMREMKYLRAFINETLRLYPAVPINGRSSKSATTWLSKIPGGKPIYIPAHTRCIYSVFLMHRREDLWGPTALQFDPDRFLDDRLHKYLTPNPFIFLPFNAGPRICLGQQFAYHEISFLLVRLLQRFSGFSLAVDVQPPSSRPPASWARSPGLKGTEKVWPASHLTMYSKGGLWVRMEEATEGAVM